MAMKNIEKDAFLFQEGDVADAAYQVVSGRVELSQFDRGQTLVIKTVGENEIFGELAAFDVNALRPYSAKVLEEAVLEIITPDEVKAITAKASAPIQALFTLAFDKMKLGRSKTVSKQNAASVSNVKRITVAPVGDKMKGLFKPVEVSPNRLPFRIGGYPEGGEVNRRDTVHLTIPVQANPLRVSRQHCEITFEDNIMVLTDLGSRFCTTVNDTTIGRGRGAYSAVLKPGKNTVTLGSAEGNYTLTVTCE